MVVHSLNTGYENVCMTDVERFKNACKGERINVEGERSESTSQLIYSAAPLKITNLRKKKDRVADKKVT